MMDRCVSYLKNAVKSTTLEPMCFLNMFALMVVGAAEISTNLKLWKCCWTRLNYSMEICDEILNDENLIYLKRSQQSVNEFHIWAGWISQAPALFYALIAGSLADDFGRKTLLIFPLVGRVITSLLEIVNYIFIDVLPFEFFAFQVLYSFFGGDSVYYLAYYAYGTGSTCPDQRAQRLARYDAFEQLGLLFGTLIGPVLFKQFGYFPTFTTKLAASVAALGYTIIFVKEVVPVQTSGISGSLSLSTLINTFRRYVVKPMVDMMRAVTRKRQQHLRCILYALLFAYSIYWFCFTEQGLIYLYALAKLKNFDGTDWAMLNLVFRILSSFAGLAIMPLLSSRLHLHDTLVLLIIDTISVISHLILPFVVEKWQFWAAYLLLFLRICHFATARSLITKCIHADEHGKVFSVIAVSTAVMPFLSSPVYRLMYNATLEHFPGSIFFFTAGLYLIAIVIYIIVYINKSHLEEESNGPFEPKALEAHEVHLVNDEDPAATSGLAELAKESMDEEDEDETRL